MTTIAVPDQASIKAAYRHCETVVRQQAKNFAYGITLLPGDKRRALSAVYAFARRIDDIGDGDLPAADKITAPDRRSRVGRAGGRAAAARPPRPAPAIRSCSPSGTRPACSRSR